MMMVVLKALPFPFHCGKSPAALGRLPPAPLRREGRERSPVAPHSGQSPGSQSLPAGASPPENTCLGCLGVLPPARGSPGRPHSPRAFVHTFVCRSEQDFWQRKMLRVVCGKKRCFERSALLQLALFFLELKATSVVLWLGVRTSH